MEAKNSAFYIVRYDAPITKCEMVMWLMWDEFVERTGEEKKQACSQ